MVYLIRVLAFVVGAFFSFEKEDVELKEINGYWTGAVTCPECKADNKVERW